MSGVKFYVLGGGRWRELDALSGRVEGWGGARFVVHRGGRLRAERCAPVLRGLRALATGRPSTVHEGPPLSQRRYEKIAKPRKCLRIPVSCACCEHPPVCPHLLHRCQVSPLFSNEALVPTTGPQRASDAAVQADLTGHRQAYQQGYLRGRKATDGNVRSEVLITAPYKHSTEIKVSYNSQREKHKTPSTELNKGREREKRTWNKKCIRTSSDGDVEETVVEESRKTQGRGREMYKELIITEEDVMLLRDFVEKDKRNVFKVDLERFDEDDGYKSRIFYKLNPLVNVERSAAVMEALRWEQRSQSTVPVQDFMTTLGLRRVEEEQPARNTYRMRRRGWAGEQDKENKKEGARGGAVRTRSSRILTARVGGRERSDENTVRVTDIRKEATIRHTRASWRLEEEGAGGKKVELTERRAELTAPDKRGRVCREYSAAEDAAIVQWVGGAGRGRRVNGNKLWRELQPEHHRLTGQFRSWHSLRNRYLRYVLPALSSFASPRVAAQLRAAAAAGEIKSRPRRAHDSFHHLPPVNSAWGRRRRSPATPSPSRSDSDHSPLDDGNHRMKQPNTEEGPRVLSLHSSTPSYDPSPGSGTDAGKRRASDRLRAGDDADHTRRRSQRTAPRARRLYNHNT